MKWTEPDTHAIYERRVRQQERRATWVLVSGSIVLFAVFYIAVRFL